MLCMNNILRYEHVFKLHQVLVYECMYWQTFCCSDAKKQEMKRDACIVKLHILCLSDHLKARTFFLSKKLIFALFFRCHRKYWQNRSKDVSLHHCYSVLTFIEFVRITAKNYYRLMCRRFYSVFFSQKIVPKTQHQPTQKHQLICLQALCNDTRIAKSNAIRSFLHVMWH